MEMPACRAHRIACIKVKSVNTTTSTNIVQLTAFGLNNSIELEFESNTGANIIVSKAEILKEIDWIDVAPTNVNIK